MALNSLFCADVPLSNYSLTLNRSSQKLAGVITSWTAPGMQNFVAIGTGVSVPQIRDFAVLLG